MHRVLVSVVVLVLAGIAGACQDNDRGPGLDLDGFWHLVTANVDETGLSFRDQVDAGDATLRVLDVGDGQAIAGCSVGTIRVETEGDDGVVVEVSDTGSMMSCPPGSQDPFDGGYFDALKSIDAGTLSEHTLVLSGDGVELTYERVPLPGAGS